MIKKTIFFSGFLLVLNVLLILYGFKSEEEVFTKPLLDLTKYVDPQIGSVHGRWFFYTPAARPFGMAKLAPHTSGYNSAGVGVQQAMTIVTPP